MLLNLLPGPNRELPNPFLVNPKRGLLATPPFREVTIHDRDRKGASLVQINHVMDTKNFLESHALAWYSNVLLVTSDNTCS